MMCEHTWLDGKQWMCWLMQKPCPYVKPTYTEECIDMKVQINTGKWGKVEAWQMQP